MGSGGFYRRGSLIHVQRLRLTNFRNYASAELRLDPGATLIQGPNGHGKSNLLEAIHMLSVSRSTRASVEVELVNSKTLEGFPVHAQVGGTVATPAGEVRLQIDYAGSGALAAPGRVGTPGVHKTLRVNGVRRRSADFVGLLKAVQFTPEDMDLASGPPQVRRRFMDLLIAQLSHRYLADWQEFSKVMKQRNALLRAIREGKSRPSEIEFWNVTFAANAGRVMHERMRALSRLSELARPIHFELSGAAEPLAVSYAPSVDVGLGGQMGEDARGPANAVLNAIRELGRREVAAGHSLVGPHRDDLKATIGDVDVASFASRGQARTVVLAMKLAEARLISESVRSQPVLLLDDVMSELDPDRQRHVLDFTSRYEQVLITTAEPGLGDALGSGGERRVVVESGTVGRS